MKRVGIHIHANLGSTWRGRLLGVALVGILLSIFLLFLLGIWIMLAVAVALVTLVGLARAFFPSAIGWLRVSRQTSSSAGSANAPSLEMRANSRSSDEDTHIAN